MMSNWNLTIRAEGNHHTDDGSAEADADVLVREFIQKLRDRGHTVLIANFTPGEEDLSRPAPVKEEPATS